MPDDGATVSAAPGVREPLPGVVYPDSATLERYESLGVLPDESLGLALKRSAERHAGRWAVSGPEGRLTYAELDERSDRLALALNRLGLEPLDRVVFQLPNSAELITALVACWKADLIPLCTLQAHRHHEIGYLAELAEARAHIIATDDDKFDFSAFAAEMRDKVASLELTLVARGRARAGEQHLDSLIGSVEAADAREFVEQLPRDPHQVCTFQLSGGTTGVSKIIPRINNEYLYNMRQVIDFIGYTERDVLLMPTPIVHNASMGCGTFPILLAGGEVLVTPKIDAPTFARLLIRFRPSIIGVIGPLVDRLKSVGFTRRFSFSAKWLLGRYALGRVRAVVGLNTARSVEETLGLPGYNIFGMTEGTIMYSRPDHPDSIRYRSVGYPISSHDEVRLLVPGTEDDVSVGETGELAVRGPYTIHGYYKAEERNREAFTSDGYYRSGDLMSAHEIDGRLYYVFEGRIKDVVDRGGEKINCEEVERIVDQHPAVSTSFCVPMPDESYGEKMCCFIVPKPGCTAPGVAELGKFLESRGLAKFKWPERIEEIEQAPATKVGKPDKGALTERIAAMVSEERAGKGRVATKGGRS